MGRRFPLSVLTTSLLAAAIVATSPVGAAGADGYPSKPVRMIVPLAPGGGSDIVARIVAQALAAQWKQSVVVDNRPGAGSTIGTTIAAGANPDGYTLLETSSSFVIGAALYRKLAYDVVRDFYAISLLASQPSIIAVNPGVNAKSLKDLVAMMQADPGKLGFGSAGRGTASHLANELFLISAGVKATHIPYKSAGLASTALLGGEIQFMVTNMATAVPLVRAGKLRGLAVTSPRRAPSVADIPTVAEAGIAGYEYVTWYGVLAPASTPQAIVSKVHGDVAKLLRSPQVKQRFAALGLDARPTTPDEFAAYVKSELAKWHGVVEAAGLEIQ
jgi:tripartite-type tricarboxylate transporter receptor subunit TctC